MNLKEVTWIEVLQNKVLSKTFGPKENKVTQIEEI
jgi:hypothetical protein